MKLEQMEEVFVSYVRKRSALLGQPISQEIFLIPGDSGIRVSDAKIEVSVSLILEGTSLEDIVDRIIALDWQLLHKAREEKRRIIEREKQLATAHIHELERLCTTDEFRSFLKTFEKGTLCKRKED